MTEAPISRFKIDPATKEKMRSLAKQGVSIKDIAIRFGLGRRSVSRIVSDRRA